MTIVCNPYDPKQRRLYNYSCYQASLLALLLSVTLTVKTASAEHQLIAMTDEVRAMCQQAEQFINAKKFKDAIQILNNANKIDANCGEVHGYLGMAYQNSLNTKAAVDEYQKALALNPQLSFINVNLGTCYMNLGQQSQAVPYFQRYLKENPTAPDADQVNAYIQQAGARSQQQDLKGLMEQGQSLLNQHRTNEARNAFQQAIAQQPDFAPAHFYLGYALAQLGQNRQAISELETCLRIDPSVKEAIVNIGSNYQSLGDCNNAIAWYERYLRETPGSNKAAAIKQRIDGLRQQLRTQRNSSAAASAQNSQAPGLAADYLAAAASGGKFFRWSHMPIRVYIAPGGGVAGYRDSFSKDLMSALSTWSQGSQSLLTFMLASDPSQADMTCYWAADPRQLIGNGQAVEGGITKLSGQPQPNGSVNITNAQVTILTNRDGVPLDDTAMQRVCLHEVGHALGINGHSNNNADIMFFSETLNAGTPTLSNRDRVTIERLYGQQ